jgi:hypothetical protein
VKIIIDKEKTLRFKHYITSLLDKEMKGGLHEGERFIPNFFVGLGLFLSRIKPLESKVTIQRFLLRRCEQIEWNIKEETELSGWYYSKLNMISNRKISSLLKIGYEFVGSDSEQLYASLHKYIEYEIEKGVSTYYLWDVCIYLDVLLTLNLNQKYTNEYKTQITNGLILIKEFLKIDDIGKQLRSYVTWLLFLGKKYGFISTIPSVDLTVLLDNFYDLHLENKFWILYNLIEMRKINTSVIKEINHIINNVNLGDLWNLSTQGAFLAFYSAYMEYTNQYVELPYPTLESSETPFFGMVVETILKSIVNMEVEKKTLSFDENSFRNRFFAVLQIRFNGLATSETFRRNGRTDIIVSNPRNPYEKVVIECKIWGGKKYYQKGMKQAMGYLRDSENKIIMLSFIRSKSYSFNMREKIKEAICSEKGYIKNSIKDGILYGKQNWLSKNYYFSSHYNDKEETVIFHHIFTRFFID